MTDESQPTDSTDQQAAATRETDPTPPVAAPTPEPDAPETPREPVAGPSPADPNAPPVPKRTPTPTFVPGFKQITTDDYSKLLSQTFPFLGLGIEIANEDPDMGQLEDKGTTWYGTIIRFGADRVEIAESLERLAQSLRSGNDARSSEQQREGCEVNRGRYFGAVAPDAGLVL